MSYLFQRWVITLGAQVHVLMESMPSKDDAQLREEMVRCEAELQALYEYAEHHEISLLLYYHPFAEIEAQLRLIDERLEQRQFSAS